MDNRERFKANIRMVEIEMHSYCNRQCWFCPNQFIDRQGPVQWLNEDILTQVLNDLAWISYDGIVSFSGNCEPFSQADEFIRRVHLVRNHLPNAFLCTNTNTDYLTPEMLQKTAKAGMDLIKAQLYFGKDEEFSHHKINQKALHLMSNLPGVNFKQIIKDQWYSMVDNMIIHAYAKDWHKVGHNRCDVQVRQTVKRMHTCGEPVQYIGVNYNGIVTPCCNLRSDYAPHVGFMLGKLDATPGKIFKLYQGVLLPEDVYPCQICMGKSWHANGQLVYREVLKELKVKQNG